MKVVTFFMSKGGTGKTSFNIMFASYLTYILGRRVLVLDVDFPEYNLYFYREREKDDYLSKDKELPENIYPIEQVQNVSENHIRNVVSNLKRLDGAVDYVIVDFPGSFTSSDAICRFIEEEAIHCDEWDTENYIPLVAFLPYDFDDQTATEVEAFDINGNSYMLSLEEEPEQPVIVVSISERVDKNGDILAFTNTFSGPYSDLYPNRSNSLGYPTKADTAPTGCKLSPSGSRSLLFEWQNVDNQGYAVFRKTTGDSDFVLCNTTELNYNYFVDNNLTPGQSYYYKVRAILGENHYSPFSYYVGAIASSRDEGERLQVKSIKFADGQALRQVEKWVSGAPELRLRIVKGGENSATIVYDSERFEPKKRSDVVGEWWEIPDNMSLYISNWNTSSLGTVLTFDWQEEDQNGKLTVEIQANYENQFESAGKVSAGGKAQYSTEYGDDHVATVYVTWWDSNKVYSTGGFSWELY